MPVIEEITETMAEQIHDINSLKEEGNRHFKEGSFEEALSFYTQALEISNIKDNDRAILYKNRAACQLKLENYEDAAEDATSSLKLTPNDVKALFRRSQAYEQLGKVEDAYKDATSVLKIDSKNVAVHPVLNRLGPIIQEKAKEQNSTASKVSQMFNLAFSPQTEKGKRLQAINNLVVLAREDSGAQRICQENGIVLLKPVLEEKDEEILQAAVRVLSNISQNSEQRSRQIVDLIGLAKLLHLMGLPYEQVSASTSHLLQNIITYMTGLGRHKAKVKNYEEERAKGERTRPPQFEMSEENQSFVDQLLTGLIKMLTNYKVSAFGRNFAMELMMKNVPRKNGVGWIKQFLDSSGIEGLLTVAGSIKQHEVLPIMENSKMHASLALSQIYDDLKSEKEQNAFKDKCEKFFKDLFCDEIFESKLEAIKAISTLLQGPFDVGNAILSIEGVTSLMLNVAQMDNPVYQEVAVEAIVHSASKQKKCSGMLNEAVPVLKQLYETGNDKIKVRALVGLCKLGSFGGTDALSKPMADGSTFHLAKACRKFLTNDAKDIDLRKWSVEGLAFLTLDAAIKEQLINDTQAIQAIIDVAKIPNSNVLFSAASVFVNLTNSYDKKEMEPEMKELAKFAKQHIPEEHELDKPEHLKERVHKLARLGMIPALVSLSKTESQNSRELLARVFLGLATEEDLRGLIVQQGGAKVLIPLSLDNTLTGKSLAAQALAKVAITMNPETAFPGQRIYETVRPLLQLLHIDMTGLQNFEALLALTNLSSVSDSVRKRIVTEKGLPHIEHYMYEDHVMLQRAAIECMCNMVMNDEVAKLFEDENDRVKLLTLFSADEDEQMVKAASGALAILSVNQVICRKITEVNEWYECLKSVCVSDKPDIQHRGCYILMNMMSSNKEIAQKIVDGQLLEVLMAVSILEGPEREEAIKCAKQALEMAVEHGLIQPHGEAPTPDMFQKWREALREKRAETLQEEEEEDIVQEEEEENEDAVQDQNEMMQENRSSKQEQTDRLQEQDVDSIPKQDVDSVQKQDEDSVQKINELEQNTDVGKEQNTNITTNQNEDSIQVNNIDEELD